MSGSAPPDAIAKPSAARAHESTLRKRLRAWRQQHAYSLVSSLGRFFRRPVATAATVGVMAVAIALPVGLGLALANIERFSGSVRESREIDVFLTTEINAERAQQLAEELRRRPDVTAVTIKTPEQGLAEFRRISELAEAFDALDGNPLPTVLIVQPRDDGAALAAALQRLPEADTVQHDAVWRQRLSAWLAFGQRLAWVIAALLGAGVLLVVGNTVRLDIGARRDEIAVLQQLGATDSFVRRPFVYLGACYGLAAGTLALVLLWVAGATLQPPLSALIASYGSAFALNGPDWRGVFALLVGSGTVGWLGAWLATGHHLRQTRPTDL